MVEAVCLEAEWAQEQETEPEMAQEVVQEADLEVVQEVDQEQELEAMDLVGSLSPVILNASEDHEEMLDQKVCNNFLINWTYYMCNYFALFPVSFMFVLLCNFVFLCVLLVVKYLFFTYKHSIRVTKPPPPLLKMGFASVPRDTT